MHVKDASSRPKGGHTRLALAGEYAALSQLALRECDAAITLANTKGGDILASNPITNRMFQVAGTTRSNDAGR
jgi:hypothetical protein